MSKLKIVREDHTQQDFAVMCSLYDLTVKIQKVQVPGMMGRSDTRYVALLCGCALRNVSGMEACKSVPSFSEETAVWNLIDTLRGRTMRTPDSTEVAFGDRIVWDGKLD